MIDGDCLTTTINIKYEGLLGVLYNCTARYTASNSRSKALYLDSGGYSIFKKKDNGCQSASMNWWGAAPNATSDASTIRYVGTSGFGWIRSEALASASLTVWKADKIGSDQQNTSGCLTVASYSFRGCNVVAAFGINQWEKLTRPKNSRSLHWD